MIGVVGVLAGLLIGAVTGLRFRSRVTACANNYRQWGIAVSLYAHEDRGNRLPAFRLPVSQFKKGYNELEPWFVALEMGTNLEHFGVTLPLWYCPTRPFSLENDRAFFAQTHAGAMLCTVGDLTERWLATSKVFAGINHNWWVPRPLDRSGEVFPDPKHGDCRTQEGWPTRLEDPNGAVQPILTDWVLAGWNEEKTELSFGGGHLFPADPPISASLRSINLLFLDGHVETRAKPQFQWQLQSSKTHVVPY